MFTNYQDVLEYLYRALPMFQRVGASAYKKDLGNTLALCKVFDDPHQKFKSVHVAGTNGKGSSSHMLASILQSAGYKTGLYTSPHLKEFTERIKINGEEVSQQFVLDFVNTVKPHIESLKPSFFEITVVMAFEYFVRQKIDIAVIEVGLGGRLDSTNVIIPEVSMITNIGYDHMDLLGDTLPKIAFEKAGVIKQDVPVVISEEQEEIKKLFFTTAQARRSSIYFASNEYLCIQQKATRKVDVFKNSELMMRDVQIPLQGDYQLKNLQGILKVTDVLKTKNYRISDDAIKSGVELTVKQTGLKGRWQQLGEKPLIICDTGHNVDGIREIVKQFEYYQYRTLFIVMGMVKDKKRSDILKQFPTSAYYFFCQAKIPRALEAVELANEAAVYGMRGEVEPDVNEAIAKAKSKAFPDDFIFIGGSTFVVAEIENL